MLRFIFCILCVSTFSGVLAQSVNIPLSGDYFSKIERYRLLNAELSDEFHPSFKPYPRKVAVEYLSSLEGDLNEVDQFNFDYLLSDSWEFSGFDNTSERTFLKHFYKVKPDAYHVDIPAFNLHVNPVIHFMLGNATNDADPVYINSRGIELRGLIDEKIGFYSFLGENQIAIPEYADNYRAGSLPHVGFFKTFKGTGYDFFSVRGYLTFDISQHIHAQFGYDRHQIGQGIRSLVLSDFAPPNLFLRLQTRIWKFNYTNLYTQMTEEKVVNPATGRYPEKYMTLHHLSLNIGKRVNVGFFEAVMSGGSSSGGYELKYLNPVIFYRAVEHQNGSADNVLVGMDAEWLIRKGISLYGQFILDEFLLSSVQSGDGWWGNKYGYQVGLNYIDLGGIRNLDLKVERNMVRPYTYAHFTSFGSFSHLEQTLAHPWGANFKETVFSLRYQPIPRLELSTLSVIGTVGRDDASNNWGSDILKDYTTRVQDTGNETTQGVPTDIFYNRIRASYMLKHNLFLDLKHVFRKEESSAGNSDSHIIGASLRLNIPDRTHEF